MEEQARIVASEVGGEGAGECSRDAAMTATGGVVVDDERELVVREELVEAESVGLSNF